ncbi:MAG: PAC2 family protein [Dehalococcoidia bacterium]
MRIGDFEIDDHIEELDNPHCIAILKPWINVGNVGRIVLKRLGMMYASEHIGQLDRPGKFYDFTRYRPQIKLVDGNRSIRTPNTRISVARRHESNDLVLLSMLEPHAFAEDYNDSVVELLKHLGVKRYIQIGGMYDSVPHSRSLPVTGSARGWTPPADFGGVKLGTSNYEGPTSMISNISDRLHKDLNVETLSLMVHLPLYLKLDDDYAGTARILKILAQLYGFSTRLPEVELGEKQYEQVSPAMNDNPELQDMVQRFEREADEEAEEDLDFSTGDRISLSSEIEQFLSDVAGSEDEPDTRDQS